ncbi:MAG: HD domain-containing protein [Solirubrobacteraceae bacterium]
MSVCHLADGSATTHDVSMENIAGIRIPDSTLAKDAHELAREHSPDFLLAHVDRTFIFGSLATLAAALNVDEELAYVAAILHDLGLTRRYGGQRRFEIDGAEVARSWARSNGMSADEADHIWHAIALHTSAGIADARSPECALVHWGAGVDVIGLGAENLPPQAVAAVHAAFPREGFADGIADLLEDAVRRSPEAYATSFLSNTATRLCGAVVPTVDEQLRQDPFATTPAT